MDGADELGRRSGYDDMHRRIERSTESSTSKKFGSDNLFRNSGEDFEIRNSGDDWNDRKSGDDALNRSDQSDQLIRFGADDFQALECLLKENECALEVLHVSSNVKIFVYNSGFEMYEVEGKNVSY